MPAQIGHSLRGSLEEREEEEEEGNIVEEETENDGWDEDGQIGWKLVKDLHCTEWEWKL